jgi:basic membrane protein A
MREVRAVLSAAVVLVLVAGIVAGPPPAAEAQAKHKIAMIMPGPIQDADFNAVGYVALQQLAKQYDVPVSHSESVAVADAERVSREYIASGHDVIIYHGGQFITISKKLAAQNPNVTFIQEASGRIADAGPNVWVIGRKFYQGIYVLGALGALATRTNKVGFVAGVRLPDVIGSINAVSIALKDYNPKAGLIHNFIGDFNDPVKARQTAEAQIAAGADFLINFVNLGIYGVAEAAKSAPRPVLVTTLYTEKWDASPKNMAVALVFDFAKPYKEIVGRILKGERTGYYEMRPGSGMELSEIKHVPADVAARVKGAFNDVASGKKQLPEIIDKLP